MDFQTLDVFQDAYDKEELSFNDYYALGRKTRISMEELEQNYDSKSLRELRLLPTTSTKQ